MDPSPLRKHRPGFCKLGLRLSDLANPSKPQTTNR